MKPAGAIFDMDGVLIDSNPFHLEKWRELLNHHRISFDPEHLITHVIGQRNDVAFRFFFGDRLRDEDLLRLSEELEERFRAAFRPHARPLDGVQALISELDGAGIPMAVASSGTVKNVKFIVDALELGPYFRCVASGDEVSRPKPDPEIYLKVAAKMELDPADCVAFEDSFVGIESATRAGMKCVAIASAFPLAELAKRSDVAVQSFVELSLERLRALFRS